jgi:hypothetical protein
MGQQQAQTNHNNILNKTSHYITKLKKKLHAVATRKPLAFIGWSRVQAQFGKTSQNRI